MRKLLRFIVSAIFNNFRLNLYSIYNIKLGKGVKLKKTHLSRNSQIGNFSTLTQTSVFGVASIAEECNLKNNLITGKITIGKASVITNCKINGQIEIGSQSTLRGVSISGTFTSKEQLRLFGPLILINGHVEIGRYTSLNGPNFDIYATKTKVNIGSFCSIARNVSFQDHNHRIDRISTYYINQNIFNHDNYNDTTSKGEIIVENDVWIGSHCVILSGAHISTGAIVAANSVVTGYVPPYAIVGGSPAKVIKFRFNPEIIEQLLKSAWWNWSSEQLKANQDLFNISLIEPNSLQKLQDKLMTING